MPDPAISGAALDEPATFRQDRAHLTRSPLAKKLTKVVAVEEIVPVGTFDPDQ
jgi:hypothetical protein